MCPLSAAVTAATLSGILSTNRTICSSVSDSSFFLYCLNDDRGLLRLGADLEGGKVTDFCWAGLLRNNSILYNFPHIFDRVKSGEEAGHGI